MTPTLGIIVVNWNRKIDTLRCIVSVRASTYRDWELLIVDNASSDGSVAAIQSQFPDVTIIQTEKNLGFTGGNNVGLNRFVAREIPLILLLNNDAVLAPDALEQLVAVADQQPTFDFFGAQICSIDDCQTILSAGGTLHNGWEPSHGGQLDNMQPHEVQFLSGCALMVRNRAISQIGGLADDYFLYYEDVDWCYRALQAEMRLMIVPQSVVYHPDTRARDELSAHVTYYEARNSLLFAKINRLSWRTRWKIWRRHLQMAVSWTLKPRWRHKRAQRDALLLALFDYMRGRTGMKGETS